MTRIAAALGLLAALATPAAAAAPTAPANLAATVSGATVSLSWTAAGNGPTGYVLQAGTAPGQTSTTVALAGSATGFVTTAPAGTYFVRLVASNADGTSPASNEITVVVGGTGCTAPAAPQNLSATFKGTALYLAWNASSGAASYVVQAGASPGTTLQEVAASGTTLNASVSAGVFYARVVAQNACGTSAASNEVLLTFPGTSGRVPDPAPGTWLPLPDVEALVTAIGQERPDLMTGGSCPDGRKYVTNDFLNFVVDRLRTYDTRWGYNQKPTKTSADNGGAPVLAAGDEIAYFAGTGTGEGSSQVYLIDILFGHCGPSPSLTWRNFTGQEPGIWTGAGRVSGDQPRR